MAPREAFLSSRVMSDSASSPATATTALSTKPQAYDRQDDSATGRLRAGHLVTSMSRRLGRSSPRDGRDHKGARGSLGGGGACSGNER